MNSEKQRHPIPLWACLLLVLVPTVAAFCLFGGANYIQHSHEVSMQLFYHEDDSSNPLVWLTFLIRTGVVAAMATFLICVISVTMANINRSRLTKPND